MRSRTMLLVASVLSCSIVGFPNGANAADKSATPVGNTPSTAQKSKPVSGAQPARLTVRQMLNARLPELKLEGIALGDAIDFLRDVSGANLHVNWRAIEAAGVTRDVVVNVRLRNVTVRKALTVILSQAAAEPNTLAFYNDDGVIEVTTKEIADSQLITRTYFVGDILMDVPDFAGPTLSLSSRNSGGSKGGGGGGSGGIFEKQTADKAQGATSTERADKLVTLITQLVRPEIWAANGGTATMTYFNGYIIVSAPRSAHELIGGPVD